MSYAKFVFFKKIEKFQYGMRYTPKNCQPPPNKNFQKDCMFSIYIEIHISQIKIFMGNIKIGLDNRYKL